MSDLKVRLRWAEFETGMGQLDFILPRPHTYSGLVSGLPLPNSECFFINTVKMSSEAISNVFLNKNLAPIFIR